MSTFFVARMKLSRAERHEIAPCVRMRSAFSRYRKRITLYTPAYPHIPYASDGNVQNPVTKQLLKIVTAGPSESPAGPAGCAQNIEFSSIMNSPYVRLCLVYDFQSYLCSRFYP